MFSSRAGCSWYITDWAIFRSKVTRVKRNVKVDVVLVLVKV